MGTKNAPHLARLLPQVVFATFVVSILPVLMVWKLREYGLVTSTWTLIVLGVLVSLLLGWIGRHYWEKRSRSADLLFGELMLWGFVRRWRTESRLASATKLLGLSGKAKGAAEKLDREQQAKLLEQLAGALESRDPYTSGHSRRVARHAAMIAKTMGLPEATVNEVRAAAVVHDVGKIDTPTKILHKDGALTDEEYEVIKLHPVRGAEMMLERDFPPSLAATVMHHHERIDGTGYPDGLEGTEIPLGARIIAVADTFDALTSHRPYRTAKPHKAALVILKEESGSQLDEDAVKAFCSHYSGFRPLTAWVIVTNLPQRLIYPVLGELQAGAASAAKVMAATAAAVGVSGAAVASTAAVEGSSAATHNASVAVERTAEVLASGDGESSGRPNAGASQQSGADGASTHGSEGLPGTSTGNTPGELPSTGGGGGSTGGGQGNTGGNSGNQGNAGGGGQGNSGGSPGNSGNAPGHSGGGSPGNSGNAPGQGGSGGQGGGSQGGGQGGGQGNAGGSGGSQGGGQGNAGGSGGGQGNSGGSSGGGSTQGGGGGNAGGNGGGNGGGGGNSN